MKKLISLLTASLLLAANAHASSHWSQNSWGLRR